MAGREESGAGEEILLAGESAVGCSLVAWVWLLDVDVLANGETPRSHEPAELAGSNRRFLVDRPCNGGSGGASRSAIKIPSLSRQTSKIPSSSVTCLESESIEADRAS